MIAVPRLLRLRVDGYALYPGTEARPGLDLDLEPGLTMVLGANGLGKTTLVTLLYRMLTGPYDIPTIEASGILGGRNLTTARVPSVFAQTFAYRVVDGATNASATLDFMLGDARFSVTRSLQRLELVEYSVNGEPAAASHEAFSASVTELANLASFADWILVLRHLVFYFEDRRALVWDPTAQRQLLRLLFLPIEASREWIQRERRVLELDSLVRNLQYSFNKEERLAARVGRAVGAVDEVRQQLDILQGLQTEEQAELERLNDELTLLTVGRQEARLNFLAADQARATAQSGLERIQLDHIAAAFPTASATGRYIIGQVLTDGECLTCGHEVPEFKAQIEARIRGRRCPICGSEAPRTARRELGTNTLRAAVEQLEAADVQAHAAEALRDQAEDGYSVVLRRVTDLNRAVATRSARIDELLKRLPPSEQALHDQRSRLLSMRAGLEEHKTELKESRAEFESLVGDANLAIARQKEAIKAEFEAYAHGFLVEECELLWQPRRSRVGECGAMLEFAAFELVMSGATFASPVHRTGPGHVSESQREFIDLSFRMALMAVASQSGGTLVIDAPESSLDAVFVKRAAGVLTRYAEQRDNRLIITSNLIDGDLVPRLLSGAGVQGRDDPRVVDLLEVAAPTAATEELRTEYEDVRARLFERARQWTTPR